MSTLRPLGVGSQILTHGDKMAGFYGEVNGIITADELRSMVGVAQGTPMQTGDITWLKFSHNYKTLFIAKQPIQHSISWDYLQSLDLVFGKMIEIGGNVYLLRLMQGANVSPSNVVDGYNSEWDNLIVKVSTAGLWKLYSDINLGTSASGEIGSATWCQEVRTANIAQRITRGSNYVYGFYSYASSGYLNTVSWRPVLELLY